MMQNSSSCVILLLIALSCLSSGEISGSSESKKTDKPFAINLGSELAGRNLTTSSLYMDGGSFNKTTSTSPTTLIQPKPVEITTHPVLPIENAMGSTWPAETSQHDKNSSIKARKGVSPNMDDTKSSTSVSCECCVNITTEEQLKNCTCCHIELKPSSTSPPPVTLNADKINTTLASTTKSVATSTPVPSSLAPSPVPHHHKPNVTSDVPEQQMPAQQEDYVIPVVGIIFAIPLIIILGALMYKKGADLWERRHYRRMDFLIDGIYNNQ